MTRPRLGLIAGAVALFAALTAIFMVLLRPLADEGAPPASHPAAVHVRAVEPTRAPAPATPAPAPGAAPPAPAPAAPTPFRPDWKGPRVAILMTDTGEDASATKAAADTLPFEIGFAFPPSKGQPLAGRERWLSMPMQPTSYPKVNPGPDTLLVGAKPQDNLRKLDAAIGSGAPAGVASMMGSAFTTDAAALGPVMQALKARGLPFIDARATPASIAAKEAAKAGVPTATNRRFIDAGGSPAANLRELEASARRDGRAIGFASADPKTVAAVAAWAKGLEARGILLAPPGSLTR